MVRASELRLSDHALWIVLIAVLLGAILATVAAAEIGLRLLQARKYGSAATVEQQYTLDKRIDLRVPIPNLRLGRIETNSLGFRGPEIRLPKPPGTVRLAFLGASTTWCAEVSGNEKVWPHLVAQELQKAFANPDVDYVNGGVPGYTVKSSLKNLEHRVVPLQPDIVVIYHATNDMSAELRRLAADRGLLGEGKVASSWLSNKSLLWNLAEKNFRIWIAQRKARKEVDRLQVDAGSLGAAFRSALIELVRRAQQKARIVALATFSARLRSEQSEDVQLQAAASALYYMPFMTPRGLLDSYAQYNRIIREVAQETGALLIDGENDIPGDATHFSDSVHFSDEGSSAMAIRVSRALLESAGVREIFGK